MPTTTSSHKPDKFCIQTGPFFMCHFSNRNPPFQTILLVFTNLSCFSFEVRNSRLSLIIFKVSMCCCCRQENWLNLWSAAENLRADADLTVFSILQQKDWTFHVNHVPSKWFTCNVTPYLPRYLHWKIMGKKMKMPSAECAERFED